MTINSTFLSNTNSTSDISSNQQDADFAEDVMATAKKMHWITSSFAGTFFVVAGLIGNILSIIIWRKKSLTSSTGRYLIALAINDIGVMVFYFHTDTLLVLLPQLKTTYAYGVFHSYIGYPMFFFCVVNSIWTLVGVTIDRYIQVCWIQQSKTLCSEKNSRMGVFLITALSFILNSPHFNTYYPIPVEDRQPTDPAYDLTEFGQGSGSQMYEFWMHCMFVVLVPWITILTMNLAIIRKVTKINRKMHETRGIKSQVRTMYKENQLTKLLLTVTFTFLMLVALQCITQCFFMLQPEISDARIVNEAYSVAKLGLIINSTINFFLYCVTGSRFRKELRIMLYRMFGCRCILPPPGQHEFYGLSSSNDSVDGLYKRNAAVVSSDISAISEGGIYVG